MKFDKYTKIFIIAVLLKVSLFIYAETSSPRSKFQNDTNTYLQTADCLANKGRFARSAEKLSCETPEIYRTPGYPVFLAFVHYKLHIPLPWVIYLQIFLSLISAYIILQAARLIDLKLAFISFFIMLFEPSISVYSMFLLTETLFLVCISLFLYVFIRYINKPGIPLLFLCIIMLSAATYIRPVSYYLAVPVGIFIFYILACDKKFKKAFIHLTLFIFIFYSAIMFWHARNYRHFHEFTFSRIDNATIHMHSIIGSYARLKEEAEKASEPVSHSPLFHYTKTTFSSVMSLFFRPASLKYFGNDALKLTGKIFAFPWIVFWAVGFLIGICRIGRNIHLQFLALLVLYFSAVTVVSISTNTGPRFFVPMAPPIAILSAHGWLVILKRIRKNKA